MKQSAAEKRRVGAGSSLALALGGLLLFAACARESHLPPPHAVAKLGERIVKYSAFERYLERNAGVAVREDGTGSPVTAQSAGALTSAALSVLFDEFVGQELLVMLARERGVATDATDPDAAVGALLATRRVESPSPAVVAAEFARSQAELEQPERVHLRQILVDNRLLAERARRELRAGAEFDEVVARLTSAGESEAPAGADQGALARDELPPAYAELVFRLPDGGVSDVVAADYGFHVFQVVRHLPGHVPDLTEARQEITDRLIREAGDAALAELSAEARSRYTVQVYERNLPFTYRGSLPTSRPSHAP